jgi:hypothetical protein
VVYLTTLDVTKSGLTKVEEQLNLAPAAAVVVAAVVAVTAGAAAVAVVAAA